VVESRGLAVAGDYGSRFSPDVAEACPCPPPAATEKGAEPPPGRSLVKPRAPGREETPEKSGLEKREEKCEGRGSANRSN